MEKESRRIRPVRERGRTEDGEEMEGIAVPENTGFPSDELQLGGGGN